MSIDFKAKTVGIWLLSVLMCLAFVLAGSVKFGEPVWPQMFAEWGYPDGFVYVIGAVEVVAGLTLLLPATAAYGAITLAIVMAGAAATHFVHEQVILVDVVLMALALLLTWARWPAMWTPRLPAEVTGG